MNIFCLEINNNNGDINSLKYVCDDDPNLEFMEELVNYKREIKEKLPIFFEKLKNYSGDVECFKKLKSNFSSVGGKSRRKRRKSRKAKRSRRKTRKH